MNRTFIKIRINHNFMHIKHFIYMFTLLLIVALNKNTVAGQLMQNEIGIYGITDEGKLVTNDYVTFDSDGDGFKEYFYCNDDGYLIYNQIIPRKDGSADWITNNKGQVTRKNDGKIEIDFPKERINEFIDFNITLNQNSLSAMVRNKSTNFMYDFIMINAYNGISYVPIDYKKVSILPNESRICYFTSVFSDKQQNYSSTLANFESDKYWGFMLLKLYTNGHLELENAY